MLARPPRPLWSRGSNSRQRSVYRTPLEHRSLLAVVRGRLDNDWSLESVTQGSLARRIANRALDSLSLTARYPAELMDDATASASTRRKSDLSHRETGESLKVQSSAGVTRGRVISAVVTTHTVSVRMSEAKRWKAGNTGNQISRGGGTVRSGRGGGQKAGGGGGMGG